MAVIKDVHCFFRKDGFELAARFTLLTLLLAQVGNYFLRPFILLVAALGLLLPHGYRQRPLWLVLCFFTSFRVLYEWPMADNHSYLLALWCLALSIACCSKAPSQILANNSRILIGLVFLLASAQKIISPDYLDGTFFRYLFLADNRFEDFAVLFGNISYQQIDNARVLLESSQFSPGTVNDDIVPVSEEFHRLVILSTWWNLLDQLVIACCFLAPVNSGLHKSRDVMLQIFCITAYAVAPVPGFGWLLISMAMAQTVPTHQVRIAYFLVFFVVLFYYEIPWAKILVDLLDKGN